MAYNPYSIARHTLLPLIYTVSTGRTLTYLLKDPSTASLLLLPSDAERDQLKPHLNNIQEQFKCKLTHSFFNSHQQAQTYFGEQTINPQSQGELRPFLLGQLSVCFIKAAGYRPDYHLVAVTHSSPTSTKFSVIFPGRLLSVCSIDLQSEAKASQYSDTLHKLKFFPNETLLFPQLKADIQDLYFAQALGSKSSILQDKINLLKNESKNPDGALAPTSLLQQKAMNPFLSPQKYSSLLGSTDRIKAFQLLRKMRMQWKK